MATGLEVIRRDIREKIQKEAAALKLLNFNENYIKSASDLTDRWGNTGLLQGIGDSYVVRHTALLMENQRLFNEVATVPVVPEGAVYDSAWWPQFKRISVPVIRRIIGEFIGFHLVSVQVMQGANDIIYFKNSQQRLIGEPLSAGTRRLERVWHAEVRNLEKEAEAVIEFARDLSSELNREIILDLSNNCRTQTTCQWKDESSLYNIIEGTSAYIGSRTSGRDATWIVMGSKLIDLLENTEELDIQGERPSSSVRYVGRLKDTWDVYEDPLYREGQILMGHKGKDPYDSGYFYCPYILLGGSPPWHTEEDHSDGMTLFRYSKKMIRDGANYYGLITVTDLPENISEKTTQVEETEEEIMSSEEEVVAEVEEKIMPSEEETEEEVAVETEEIVSLKEEVKEEVLITEEEKVVEEEVSEEGGAASDTK